jgi:hypothetical protein
MLTSVIHDFFHWQTRCHIGTDCHQSRIGKSVAFNGLRRHLVHQTRMTLVDSVVMDEGNSSRGRSFVSQSSTNSIVTFQPIRWPLCSLRTRNPQTHSFRVIAQSVVDKIPHGPNLINVTNQLLKTRVTPPGLTSPIYESLFA